MGGNLQQPEGAINAYISSLSVIIISRGVCSGGLPELVQSTMRLQCVHDHMMRSSSSAAMNRGRRGSPFTSRQWAELEHQALIFKYMMAGINVPEELLYPIRRSVAASLMINAASMTTTHNGCRWDGSLTS